MALLVRGEKNLFWLEESKSSSQNPQMEMKFFSPAFLTLLSDYQVLEELSQRQENVFGYQKIAFLSYETQLPEKCSL